MSATPNPAQVMSTLRMLGDKELAQYASMHKKDPYIFPLAFQESNLRKQMRAQGAGSAGPQPPINDQALQAMATQQAPMPEDVGLGRIAPPGVANMAGGGIVGFAAGEIVGTPVMDGMRWEDLPPVSGDPDAPPSLRFAQSLRDSFSSEKRLDPKTGKPISFGEFMNRANGSKRPSDENYGNEGRRGPLAIDRTPAVEAVPEAKPGVPPAAGLGALGGNASARTSMSASGAVGAGGAAPAAGPGIPRMELPAKPGVFDPDKAYDERMARPTVDPLAEQRQGVVDAESASAKRQYEGLQGLAARQDQILNKQEGRLDARQGDIEKESKRNEAMSWITAGLEMLQARGPGLSAIAGGAQKGFGQYAAGLEKAKLAQERIDDARDKLDAARLGTEKERLSAQREYDMALNAGKREMFKGVETAFGLKSSVAQNMVKMYADSNLKDRELYAQGVNANNNNATQLQIGRENNATELQRARIAADASVRSAGASGNKQIELYTALGNGDVKKGVEFFYAAQAGKVSRDQLYNKYLVDFKANPLDPKSKPLTPPQYNAVMDQLMGAVQVTSTTDTPSDKGVRARD